MESGYEDSRSFIFDARRMSAFALLVAPKPCPKPHFRLFTYPTHPQDNHSTQPTQYELRSPFGHPRPRQLQSASSRQRAPQVARPQPLRGRSLASPRPRRRSECEAVTGAAAAPGLRPSPLVVVVDLATRDSVGRRTAQRYTTSDARLAATSVSHLLPFSRSFCLS